MSNIGLIIKREYLSRVTNKTFIILTFLAPLLYSLVIFLPILLAKLGAKPKDVLVVDTSGRLFAKASELQPIEKVKFHLNTNFNRDQAIEYAKNTDSIDYVYFVPPALNYFNPTGLEVFSTKKPNAALMEGINNLTKGKINELRMTALRINSTTVDSLQKKFEVKTTQVSDTGDQEVSTKASSAAAFAGGFLIYIFIFLYGGLVMRGVQEEKQNRVVEVLIASVKPFKLMMGKIVGIAMVGLTQFLAWILLTLLLSVILGSVMGPSGAEALQSQAQGVNQQEANDMASNIMASIGGLPLFTMLFTFLIYFLGGYLIYSSLFAAAAAATDNQTDTQQVMFPISLPVILSIIALPSVVNNPDGSLAFWLSMIPFSSPIIMMARIPFDVPLWQRALSIGILIASFFGIVWFSAKIYRVGILMYGKKVNLKEIIRWIRY